MGEEMDAHVLFKLTVLNDGQLPIKMHTKFDVNFLGLKVPNVGFLILKEPNSVLDRKHHTKLPGIIGRHLILLAYQVLLENYGEEISNSFECPEGINPLLFSQLYHYAEISKENYLGVQSIYHQTSNDIQSNPCKLAHLAKKPSHPSLGKTY